MIKLARPGQWSPAMKIALALVIMLVLLACGLVVEYVLIVHVISHSQQQWCDTLKLLTTTKTPKPLNPSVNPSREQAYNLYEDFVHLHSLFSCTS
jgi:uncharacterized protein (UPF0333 family)